jgi:hypothetical protein
VASVRKEINLAIFGVFELKDMNLTEFFTVHEFPIQQKSNQEWEELINKQLASCFDYDVLID